MNENINLVELLKDCPKGTKLYTPIAGEVFLEKVHPKRGSDCLYPIDVLCGTSILSFSEHSLYFGEFENEECILFPSKDQRDWSKWKCPKPKFDPKTFKPFENVLARDTNDEKWIITLYGYRLYTAEGNSCGFSCANGAVFRYCIPYNDETKHLVGTSYEAPEYYRYWED